MGREDEELPPLVPLQLCRRQAAIVKTLGVDDQARDVAEHPEVVRREGEVVAIGGAAVADGGDGIAIPIDNKRAILILQVPDLPGLKRADHPSLGELTDAPVGDGAARLGATSDHAALASEKGLSVVAAHRPPRWRSFC